LEIAVNVDAQVLCVPARQGCRIATAEEDPTDATHALHMYLLARRQVIGSE
jgi:hypothetical protein